ncbi:hypothetical protein I7I50_06293 [Histoplasma capsulatum G186AR]|uniref:Uncharacterized protein n=1 Tax=Ajellomyces capsulatus TaxID=5037 RepID=A0A8H7YWZ5_AJECA|nr:hypothetical protein I7I52_10634 [Histoplasma capsulatum]QSS67271.1 hypothetical protein I7I50_06293 [Histoplasma capsulatum G186AR]
MFLIRRADWWPGSVRLSSDLLQLRIQLVYIHTHSFRIFYSLPGWSRYGPCGYREAMLGSSGTAAPD